MKNKYYSGDIYETMFTDRYVSFSEKRLAASICSDTGYLLDGALLFHVCSEIRSSSHGVRIAYSLQHKYDRLTSISCYSSSTHGKDDMEYYWFHARMVQLSNLEKVKVFSLELAYARVLK